MNIGIFYGSTTCYTEIVAEKIQAMLAVEPSLPEGSSVTLHNLKQQPLSLVQQYDVLIFGISTWDFGELQEDWEAHWHEVSTLDLSGKLIALYGMGDQLGYSDWFVDALGMLHEALAAQACIRLGFWPTEGYEFTASKALNAEGTHFVGLAIDEENQYEQTDERLSRWLTQLFDEMIQLT